MICAARSGLDLTGELSCSDITNDKLGISGETGHGGVNLCVY